MIPDRLEPIYNLAQCAEYLQCSHEWLRQQLRARAFAALKVAGRWQMTETQLRAALDTLSTVPREPERPNPSGLSRRSKLHRRRLSA